MAINDKKISFLSKGSKVEVTNEEEGLNGAWYEAKIVTLYSDPNGEISVMSRDFRGHAMPRSFHISLIRPLPPPPAANQSYEPLDLVDAFVLYGWWKGFVRKVEILNSTKLYTVVLFENPPESVKQIFTSEELRFHLVWTVDGKWVRPPYQQDIPNVADCEEQSHNTASDSKEIISFTPNKNLLEQSTPPPSAASTNKKLKKSTPETGETHNGLENKMAEFTKKREREPDVQVTNHQVAAAGEKETCLGKFNQSSAVNGQQESVQVKNQEMPFKKSLSHWQHVDSLQVFQMFPQKPHFRPLSGCNEETCEALALGHMMTFASLVEKASKLKIDDPRSVYESYLEALCDLEKLGFEVKPVVDCINELLSFKTSQERLKNRFIEAAKKFGSCI